MEDPATLKLAARNHYRNITVDSVYPDRQPVLLYPHHFIRPVGRAPSGGGYAFNFFCFSLTASSKLSCFSLFSHQDEKFLFVFQY